MRRRPIRRMGVLSCRGHLPYGPDREWRRQGQIWRELEKRVQPFHPSPHMSAQIGESLDNLLLDHGVQDVRSAGMPPLHFFHVVSHIRLSGHVLHAQRLRRLAQTNVRGDGIKPPTRERTPARLKNLYKIQYILIPRGIPLVGPRSSTRILETKQRMDITWAILILLAPYTALLNGVRTLGSSPPGLARVTSSRIT